jgi:CRP-like cAMP-binding protein
MYATAANGSGNRLLEVLPERAKKRVLSLLEPEDWDVKEMLIGPGQRLHSVYFPVDGVVSQLALMEDGEKVEIATIGNEGMAGAPIFLGARSLGDRELMQVQVSGTILRAKASALLDQAREGSALRAVIERYLQAYLRQVTQQVACNLLHPVIERCARWILLTHDRVGRQEFPMTQEFLSEMLGVRRASVSTSARSLQTAGFLRFDHGVVKILNRRGLEESTCECYGIVRSEFDRLLGPQGK